MADLEINEGTSAELEFDIVNASGVLVPKAQMASATYTLSMFNNPAIVINEREDEDMLSVITASGHATIYLSAADNQVITPGRIKERHVVTITVSGTGGSPAVLTDEIYIIVKNLQKVS